MKIFLLSVASLLVAAPAVAQVRWDLRADVRATCSLDRVHLSKGVAPTVQIKTDCNLPAYTIRFARPLASGEVRGLSGSSGSRLSAAGDIRVTTERPGSQVTLIHFERGTDLASLGAPTLTD